jgi:flagellar hook-basal body complex protein FliE
MDITDKIKDKIRKLLALSESSNANEAASAEAMAHDMLLQYNLDMGELEVKSAIKEEEIETGSAERVHETYLKSMIASYNLCTVFRKNGHTWNNNGRRVHNYKVILVGKEHNIAAVRVMCDYVFEVMVNGAIKFKGAGREAVFSYKKAFCLTLANRIGMMIEEAKVSQTSDCTALVVQTDAELKAHMAGKNLKKAPPINTNVKDPVGYLQGRIDAGNVSLNAQIGKSEAKVRLA